MGLESRTVFNRYGFDGTVYVRHCQAVLSKDGFGIAYNEKTRQFTVLNAKGLTKEAVQAFFYHKLKEPWYFVSTDQIDRLGDRVIALQSMIQPYLAIAVPILSGS